MQRVPKLKDLQRKLLSIWIRRSENNRATRQLVVIRICSRSYDVDGSRLDEVICAENLKRGLLETCVGEFNSRGLKLDPLDLFLVVTEGYCDFKLVIRVIRDLDAYWSGVSTGDTGNSRRNINLNF